MRSKGFIGLGVMGFPMASHLQKGSHDVRVYNRSQEKSIKWAESSGGGYFLTPEEAAEGCDVVFLCVGRDEDVRLVVTGEDGLLKSLKPGSIIVDHTTTSATLAEEMSSACLNQEIAFIDAPLSGGQIGAETGQLTIMAGGDLDAFNKIKDLLSLYSKFVRYMGESGSGQLTKMVNQICIAGLIQGLAEGINFSEKAGLDTRGVIDVISKGAAQSWQMDNRWETMLSREYDHGFAVDWMRKDLGIALEESEKNAARMDITRQIDQYYEQVQSMGGGRWDTSSLLKRLQDE
jgi:3-hydroxyisobutyrate dehydrogenase-like beta-hydroxyacid dehydrogenase|tara:strand:- start:160 stop:1029 length:870 start_codon:yes stop_codon:yes gene_type:complete